MRLRYLDEADYAEPDADGDAPAQISTGRWAGLEQARQLLRSRRMS